MTNARFIDFLFFVIDRHLNVALLFSRYFILNDFNFIIICFIYILIIYTSLFIRKFLFIYFQHFHAAYLVRYTTKIFSVCVSGYDWYRNCGFCTISIIIIIIIAGARHSGTYENAKFKHVARGKLYIFLHTLVDS